MKKNLNIIKINGIRGLLFAGMVLSCLAAGFIAFPGFVAMHVWNFMAALCEVPKIGLLQGFLLWCIIVAAYFTFRKNKVVVCIKTPQGLSEEELKEVFADMKRQAKEDPVLQAMLKAREAELKIQRTDSETNETLENNTKI